jgi:hypothetical protein
MGLFLSKEFKMFNVNNDISKRPDPKLKGVEGGNCNRTACQAPGAYFFGKSTRVWYCRRCAEMIEASAVMYDKEGCTNILFDGLGINKENYWRYKP